MNVTVANRYVPVGTDDIDLSALEFGGRLLADDDDWQIAAPLKNRTELARTLRVEVLSQHHGARKFLLRVLTSVERAPTPPAEEPTTTRSFDLLCGLSSIMVRCFRSRIGKYLTRLLTRPGFHLPARLCHLFHHSATLRELRCWFFPLPVRVAQTSRPHADDLPCVRGRRSVWQESSSPRAHARRTTVRLPASRSDCRSNSRRKKHGPRDNGNEECLRR